ncbi:ABC transporter substrate-binding protein [Chelatococcus sp. SYSU_G07232]|uniref:ABC transporter substrate-binding protein n=1 Tax=Chelatococcus albus TaxID=3047466 RepID=A0ABT7AK00_9HYPH|nr:ABC transporter substrate-binding protein [Chelatococcus sp. SYSU_G07232]MDJ1159144.1 ABC transporter substrate-binding protein [Chelatococcus sp. SYSU_G07232]
MAHRIARVLSLALVAGIAGFAAGVASAAPRKDVTLGVRLEPPHLDPTAGAAAAIGEVVYANVFEGLTRIDRNGAVKPALAERWEVSPDGRTYTFFLRKGVKFHDGTDFDASDVKFTLDRARAADSVNPQKGLFAPIEAVEVVDPATVKVALKQPTGRFLFDMGWAAAVIVAPESAADNRTKPVGTGPFTLATWAKGDRIELARNPNYWGRPAALDKATFKIIGDPTAAFAALMAGDVDAFPIYPAPENVDQFKADPRFKVVVGNTEGKTILAMNNGRAPFTDIRVRRALSQAVDRKAVIDGAMYGYGAPIGSHFAPQDKGYVDLTGRYPHDPKAAQALLKEAGVAAGTRLRLVLPPPDYARRGGEIIAAQLRKVGIEAELVPMEWAQWLSEVFKNRNYDLTVISHVEPLDLDIYARESYYFDYKNPEYKALYDELAATSDEGKRIELLKKAQEKIADDAVNVFLFLLPKIGIWNAELKGLWENAPIPVNDLTEVRWGE